MEELLKGYQSSSSSDSNSNNNNNKEDIYGEDQHSNTNGAYLTNNPKIVQKME
jgi:hypothetical protein